VGLKAYAFETSIRGALVAGALLGSQTARADPPALGLETIGRLELAWTFRTGNPRGHAGAPAVSGDSIFVLTPFPHALVALDLQGHERWRVVPDSDPRAEGLATGGGVTDGPVLAGGRLYLTTLDGHAMAVEAATGRVAWDRAVASLDAGETLRNAPLVQGGRVYVGSAGDDAGARGWLAALDSGTGRELWRRLSTGPDGEVGIGPQFRSAYPTEAGADLGVRTWPPEAWRQGGGSPGPILADAELGVVVYGTGHPAPWNPDQRPGSNRWTSGLFARDAATGAARWFTPTNPHDEHAYGAASSNLLVDRPWRGVDRKLLVHPDPNGFLQVLDRETGLILSAKPIVPTNAVSGLDAGSGAPVRADAKRTHADTMTRDICPAWTGPVLAEPALSAETGFVLLPTSRLCMDLEPRDSGVIPGTLSIGANVRLKVPAGPAGALVAWDLEREAPAWTAEEPLPLAGGVLATGGLAIYGTLDGRLKALDARSGRSLWEYRAPSGIIGRPVAFTGPDGRAYLAVLAGVGGPLGQAARGGIDVRDATAAGGLANAVRQAAYRDILGQGDESGSLLVFRLP